MKRWKISADVYACLVFGAAGFVGNWFGVEIFYGQEFLIGSFFVMFAIMRARAHWGALAGLIAAACTYLIWHHPWAVLVFAFEALFVSVLYSRRKGNIVIYDIAYWILLGMPMIYLFYHSFMGVQLQSTFFIMLKQMVNGVFNSLFAFSAVVLLRCRKRVEEERVSFSHLIFAMTASAVLLPALLYCIIDLRAYPQQQREAFEYRLSYAAEVCRSTLADWVEDHHKNIRALAGLAGDPHLTSVGEMQHAVETVKASSSTCSSLGLLDEKSVSIAFAPREDEKGRSMLGVDFSDNPYLSRLRTEKKPLIGDLVSEKVGGVEQPVLQFLSPIVVGGEYMGVCIGFLDIGQIDGVLQNLVLRHEIDAVTLVDGNGKIIAGTIPNLKVMDSMPPSYVGMPGAVEPDIYHRMPDWQPDAHIFQRWKESSIVKTAPLSSDYGWRAIVESPFSPVFERISNHGIRALTLLSVLTFVALILSHLVSQIVVSSILKLLEATRHLPEQLEQRTEIRWPESNIEELAQLSMNFRDVGFALNSSFKRLAEFNRTLEQRVLIRTEELHQEVEERRRTEASLRESEEKYRVLFENRLFAVCILDLENLRFIDVNETFLRIYGYGREELTGGMSIYDVVMVPDEWSTASARAISGETMFVPIQYHRKKDRTAFPVEIVGGPYLWRGRKVMFALAKDITDKAKSDIALQASEERFRKVFEESPLGMAIIDFDYRFVKVNSRFCDMLGYSERELSELTFPDVAGFNEVLERENFLGDVLRGESPVLDIENIYKTSEGEKIWGHSTISAIRYDDGSSLYGLITVEDITRRRLVEEELDTYREHLESLVGNRTGELASVNEQLMREIEQRKRVEEALRSGQRELHALAAKLAESEEIEKRRLALELHDRVGQNLSTLNINLNILKNLLSPESDPRYNERIRDSLALVRETFKSIRDVMADLRPPVLDDYGLAAALRWYADMFRERTGIQITVQAEDFASRLPLHVESGLFRVAQEALSNVARHSKACIVAVELRYLKRKVRMVISDNGVGFDLRAESAREGREPSWGLMSMRERAEGVGGTLLIRSNRGKGTTVIVSIPAVAKQGSI